MFHKPGVLLCPMFLKVDLPRVAWLTMWSWTYLCMKPIRQIQYAEVHGNGHRLKVWDDINLASLTHFPCFPFLNLAQKLQINCLLWLNSENCIIRVKQIVFHWERIRSNLIRNMGVDYFLNNNNNNCSKIGEGSMRIFSCLCDSSNFPLSALSLTN